MLQVVRMKKKQLNQNQFLQVGKDLLLESMHFYELFCWLLRALFSLCSPWQRREADTILILLLHEAFAGGTFSQRCEDYQAWTPTCAWPRKVGEVYSCLTSMVRNEITLR